MRKHYISYTVVIILASAVFANVAVSIKNISALSYSSDVNIGFTFNPTLSLSVSGDLIIPNLTPGSSADSNSITVSVATNTAYGYTLTSTVGSNDNNNGNNSRNLVNNVDSNQTFTSLDYGSNVSDKTSFNDNTWGYSYSLNNGTTWKPYSGLPLYSDTTKSTVLYNTYDAASSISLDFKIAAKSSTTQASGEYTNIVNFYAVSVPEPPLLYDVVQDMTKGTLADNNVKLSDTITQANSGVYTYDSDIYGVASDASNDYDIYFYRGILDTDVGLGIYGSDGQADAWPNYVKLSNNTCWRIVRTTGSGGVKMIYNGLYGATTAGSCANATTDTQTGTRVFNNSYNSAVYVGYTYNSDIASSTDNISVDDIFGGNEHPEYNNTRSTIKTYIEDTWYANNMMFYTNKLEPSAGYCSDRTVYSDLGALLSEIIPKENVLLQFGGNYRLRKLLSLTLNCPRGDIDEYRYTGSINNYVNNELKYPVALLTADEARLAGNIPGNVGGLYSNIKSYLVSGSNFWLLSPYQRGANGISSVSELRTNGIILFEGTFGDRGVRPVISLMHHIQVTGGNGTATSPWTIE